MELGSARAKGGAVIEAQTNQAPRPGPNWIEISYWVAAALQFIGTVVVLWRFGGALPAIAGGICLELLLLALADGIVHGRTRGGFAITVAIVATYAMLAVSGALQVAEIRLHSVDSALTATLGPDWVELLRLVAALAPTSALAVVVSLKLLGRMQRAIERRNTGKQRAQQGRDLRESALEFQRETAGKLEGMQRDFQREMEGIREGMSAPVPSVDERALEGRLREMLEGTIAGLRRELVAAAAQSRANSSVTVNMPAARARAGKRPIGRVSTSIDAPALAGLLAATPDATPTQLAIELGVGRDQVRKHALWRVHKQTRA